MTHALPIAVALAALLASAPAALTVSPPAHLPTTAAALSTGSLSTAAEETPPPAGTTWALRPATTDGPDGRVSLRHVIDGGDSADDLLALTNFGGEPATFAVYASDGTITSDGNFDLIPGDQVASDGGSWIALGAIESSTPRDAGGLIVSVPAQTTIAIPVQITVPANATPGDHPAGIVAELVPDASSSVQLASRVGVRAHIRVTGDIVASLAAKDVSAHYTPSWNPFAPGTVTLSFALTNPGNVRLGAETVARLSGPFGLAEASVAGEQREVFPGQAVETTIELPVWPTFFSWGDVATTPAAVGEDVIDGPLVVDSAPYTLWTVPWAQLGLLALLAAVFFLIRFLRARSSRRMQERIDAAVAAATSAGVPAAADSAEAPGPTS